jgi:hypothetical protein
MVTRSGGDAAPGLRQLAESACVPPRSGISGRPPVALGVLIASAIAVALPAIRVVYR